MRAEGLLFFRDAMIYGSAYVRVATEQERRHVQTLRALRRARRASHPRKPHGVPPRWVR